MRTLCWSIVRTSVTVRRHADTLPRQACRTPMTIAAPLANAPAPTMGRLAKVNYTHLDMIDFILANPACSHRELAVRYGYSESWVSNVMASDAWQSQFARRREEVVDAGLAATIEERMRALVIRSQEILMHKMENREACPPQVALKALELGARGLGLGQPQDPAARAAASLEKLADRLIELNPNRRTYEGQASVVSEASEVADTRR